MRLVSPRGWAAVAAAGSIALALVLFLRGGEESQQAGAVPRSPEPVAKGGAQRIEASAAEPVAPAALAPLLDRAVSVAARENGGTVQAALMLDGWPGPVVAASEDGAAARPMRMWSVAKVLTAVALLRELGWADRPGSGLSPQLAEAMHDAIVRSENCRQRRLVLGLQHLTGGPVGAQAAIAAVLATAGAQADLAVDVEAPEPICDAYLSTQEGSIPDPYAPTLLLGTATWRIADLASFMHALGRGAYGASVRERLLSLMRVPKGRSTEVPSSEYTAALDWGAGRALSGLDPAYKAGWGGTLQGSFVALQGAVVELPGGGTMALAVAFHPDVQPPRDDPGLTAGPAAIESVMRAVADGPLGGESGPGGDR